MPDHLVEFAKLEGKLALRVHAETRAVEHLIVLPADHVKVDERQARLFDARAHHAVARLDLAPVIGRAVRHGEHLGTLFGKVFADRIGPPRILADRDAQRERPDLDRVLRFCVAEQAFSSNTVSFGSICFRMRRRTRPLSRIQ